MGKAARERQRRREQGMLSPAEVEADQQARARKEFLHTASAASQFPVPQGGEFAALEKVDRFALSRNKLRAIAHHAKEWAGIPMPIEGERLVIEPSYPFAEVIKPKVKPDRTPDDGGRVRNRFWSTRWKCEIAVCQDADGTIWHAPMRGRASMVEMMMRTLGVSVAWGIEQESKAVQLLGTLLRHNCFKHYLLTGMFLETSKRSGVHYIFRRLKPTIAMGTDPKRGMLRIITTLCMHPIGYYAGTWGGAMCPTDDVIAHLMLMRGDEHLFWKRCNQHDVHHPEAGV